MTKPKINRLALVGVLVASLAVGGCSVTVGATAAAIWASAKQAVVVYLTGLVPQSTLEKVKGQIADACIKAQEAEMKAISIALSLGVNPDSCRARNLVAKERAAFAPICQNLEYLTDDIVGNYYSRVRDGLKKVSNATAVGC